MTNPGLALTAPGCRGSRSHAVPAADEYVRPPDRDGALSARFRAA
jgi:hypothetical protein